MKKVTFRSLAALAVAAAAAVVWVGVGGSQPARPQAAEATGKWAAILAKARGQTVNFYMWGGSDRINSYVSSWVGARAKPFGIKINRVPLTDTVDAVNKVLGEKQAGRTKNGSVDLIWVNGENFRTGKQARIWHCGYVNVLPNGRYVNWKDPSVANDFGTPVDGCEVPWGRAQFALVYNSDRVKTPPTTMAGLLSWIRSNPGRFTYPAPPDFTGSVFVRHVFYHAAGGFKSLLGPFNQAKFDQVAPKAWSTLNDVERSLWRSGATYPQSKQALDNLYSNGEVDMTMTYGPAEIGGLVDKGIFPASTREFVFNHGTIGNTHYTIIPFNSAHKEAAMVVQNILISPAAQYQKALPSGWGDYAAIDTSKVSKTWQRRFASIKTPPSVLPYSRLRRNSNPELRSDWLTKIEAGWKENVLQK